MPLHVILTFDHNSIYDMIQKVSKSMYYCRDFQKKKDSLKLLKRKALDRNPDEFYFNMVKTVKKVC